MGELDDFNSDVGSSISPRAHALLLPYPAQGHVNPLMDLGKRLAVKGVFVTVAVIEHIHAKIVHAQQPLVADHPNFQLLGIKDGLPPDFNRENWSEMNNVIDKTLADGTLDLIHTLASHGRPITCVVGDFFLRWTSSLAEKAGVPEFIFWPQCASIFSIYLHVDAIISSTGYDPFEANVGVATAKEAPNMKLITCIPGLVTALHPADLPFECGPFGTIGLKWFRDALRDRFHCMGEAHGLIANSFEALEPEVLKALTLEFEERVPHPQYYNCWPRTNIRLVGPLVPRAALGKAKGYDDMVSGGGLWKEEVEECKEWLDSQPAASVLFVAFGSIVAICASQAQELAFGLVASGQKFLWVVREKGITGSPTSLDTNEAEYVSLEEALPQGFLEQNQHLCRVVRWAPQALVLSHASVGGFFSHCGWNSTLESLCCGVPILGWPWLMDQATNCWLASHVWKVGLTLERDPDNQTRRVHVENGVRQLMEGPLANSLRTNARKVRALALEANQRGLAVLSLSDDICNLACNA